MFCRYCGYLLADNAHFCTKCGKAVVATTPPPIIQQQESLSTPPPINTPTPIKGYSPKDLQQGVQKTFNNIHYIIVQLRDNDIKASATCGEIICSSSPSQNAFLRLMRKGKFFLPIILCLFACLGSFAQEIQRTVSTGFGTITYTITGVEQDMELIDSQGRLEVEKKEKDRNMYYRDENDNMKKEVIKDVYRYHNTFNTYRIYQSDIVKVKVTFSPAGSNSTKETKYHNVGTNLEEVTRYTLFSGYSNRREKKNVTLVRLEFREPPYQFEDMIATGYQEDGVWIRIGARYLHQYLSGTTYKEEIEGYYDEFHIMPPRKGSTPVEESEDNSIVTNPPGDETTPPSEVGPIHEKIDTQADDEPGESGWIVPSLIGAIAVGGGLLAWNKRRKKEEAEKKKKKSKATTPPPTSKTKKSKEQEEDEYNEHCVYEMRIKKDCGDTLVPGDKPVTVYARIIRYTPEGNVSTDPVLTRMIRITGDDYLQLSPTIQYGEYVAANVLAPNQDVTPAEAVVNFAMSAEGVSFTINMHFNVEGAEILFGQDNLTLPAGYEKTVELPFVILGLGEDPKVELSVEKDSYHVELKKKDDLWFAVLNENKNCADFKNKLEPGQYNYYSLHIKATDENGRKVETDFPICRFQMGLTIDTTYLKCYIEEYNSSKHLSNRYAFDQVVNTTPWNSTDEPKYEVRKMAPAETKSKLRLFEYDEENHQVLRIPAVPDEIKFEAVEENRKELVEKLGIDWEPLKNSEEGARPIVFRCIRHGLDAPLRIKAKMIVKTTFNNRKYELEKEVRLHSQPVRQSQNMEDSMGQLKEDERLTDVLIHIQECIFSHGYLKNLAPLDRYIQNMLDGYDATYGYDKEQMRTVRRIWTSFLQGTFAGANGEAEKVTLGDELMMFFDAFMAKGKEVEDSLGFFSRMAIGVFTLGCSEVVFTSMEVVREMKDYVDKGGDSVFGAFCCGVKVVAREYIMEKVSDLGMGMLKNGATKVGLTPENLKAKAKEYYGNITRGRQMKQAISDTKIAKANAKVKVEQTKMLTQNTHLDMDEIKMKNAEIEGLEIGKKKIEKFKEVMDLPDNPKNTKLKNEMAMEIQKDKNAMSLLADYDNTAMNDMRSKFNKQIQDLSDGADYEVMYQMAADHNIPLNEVKKLNASASSKAKLKSGEKITFDHDATFYHETKTGKRTYFNQIETEKMYNKKYYKEYHGQYAVTTETNAAKFAKNADQTVIQSDFHPESYGNENFKILSDANSKTKALADANMVGDAMTYKCNEWYFQGMKELADPKTASAGIAKIREGCRQCYKQYDNYLSPRNMTRSGVNGGNKIPPEFHAYMRILKEMDVNKGGSVLKAKRELEHLGTSFEKVFQQLGDLMREVG